MTVRITQVSIDGVLVVEPERHGPDTESRLHEAYRQEWFPGLQAPIVQMTRSSKPAGVLAGMHYHLTHPDIWYVARGSCRAALYDLRRGSPTEGISAIIDLGESGPTEDFVPDRSLFIPAGVAHGYFTTSPMTIIYLFDRYYGPGDDIRLAWNDPDLAIPWGFSEVGTISSRDAASPRLTDLGDDVLPRYA